MRRWPRWQLGLGRENGLAFWAVVLMEASFASYMLLWPLFIAQLGANPTQVGLIVGTHGLLRLVFLVPSGYLVDRFAPVPLIVITRAVGVVGLVAAAVTPVWWLLPLPLLIMGVGNIAFPAISAIIAGAAGDQERARAFTLVYTVGPAVATVVAPLIGGQVAGLVSLRAALLLGAGFSAASIVVYSRLRAPRPPQDEAAPPSYREALASGPVRTLCLLQLATLLVLTTGTTLAPNYLREVHGLTFERIGQLGSISALGSILLGLGFARLQPFKQPLAGITAATAGTGLAFAVLVLGESLPVFMLAFLLRGGYMVAWSLYAAALGNVAPPRLHGRAFALSEIAGGIGFALAPFLAGPLYSWQPAAPLLVGFACSLPLAAVLGLTALRERRAAREEAEPALVESAA